MEKLAVIAFVAVGMMQCQVYAQSQSIPPSPPEYLTVESGSDESPAIFIRPSRIRLADGTTVSNSAWFGPSKPNSSIRLPGYEPFDIVMREGGYDTVLRGVKLCQWMRECARGGRRNWEAEATIGRWLKDNEGNSRFVEEKSTRTIAARADKNRVTIQFSAVSGTGVMHDPDRKPKLPKRGKGENPESQ